MGMKCLAQENNAASLVRIEPPRPCDQESDALPTELSMGGKKGNRSASSNNFSFINYYLLLNVPNDLKIRFRFLTTNAMMMHYGGSISNASLIHDPGLTLTYFWVRSKFAT